MKRFLPTSTAAALLLAGALFASATGGAVAGSMVTGKQIKNGSVTGKDLKDGSVGSADLAQGVVTAGPAGAPGAPGLSGAELVVVPKAVPASGSDNLRVDCPAGKILVNAEAGWSASIQPVQFRRPPGDLDSVLAYYTNPNNIPETITVTVLCAKVG